MSDYISREAAIDAFHFFAPGIPWDKVQEVFDEIPTADVRENVRGKWIYGEDAYGIDGYHCNKCGFFVPWDYVHYKFINYIEDYNFCPNCGARMEVEE